MHPDRYVRAGFAAKSVHGIVQGHIQGRFVIDLGDSVVAFQACSPGGCVGHGSHDRQLLITDRNYDAKSAEMAGRREIHLPVSLRTQEHAVRIERAQDSVARRVLDLTQVELWILLEVFIEEDEDFTEPRRYVPDGLNIIDPKLPRFGFYLHLHVRGLFRIVDDDLGYILLHFVQGTQEHLARFDARRIDVFIADCGERLVDGNQLGQVVGCIALARGGNRVRYLETTPQPSRSTPKCEEGRKPEDSEHAGYSQRSFECAHRAGRSIGKHFKLREFSRQLLGALCKLAREYCPLCPSARKFAAKVCLHRPVARSPCLLLRRAAGPARRLVLLDRIAHQGPQGLIPFDVPEQDLQVLVNGRIGEQGA